MRGFETTCVGEEHDPSIVTSSVGAPAQPRPKRNRRACLHLVERRHLRFTALCIALLGLACASSTLRPGTGHVTFRLTWTGLADLDLYVLSPLGERVDFLHRRVDSGGSLDIDCNVAELICPSPMENIYWPRGDAPTGSYKYWMVIANADGLQPADTYSLRVLFLGQTVAEHSGRIVEVRQQPVSGELRVE